MVTREGWTEGEAGAWRIRKANWEKRNTNALIVGDRTKAWTGIELLPRTKAEVEKHKCWGGGGTVVVEVKMEE